MRLRPHRNRFSAGRFRTPLKPSCLGWATMHRMPLSIGLQLRRGQDAHPLVCGRKHTYRFRLPDWLRLGPPRSALALAGLPFVAMASMEHAEVERSTFKSNLKA